ncbi:hypothetical protein H5410_011741 [Solanum commersonii]|uniref:Uncharacterized protein n=1 Tax=Solanum commersonii TaxID=4109 RepID=A0A9J6AQI9_SOLCO|nr:hypothetical protein H5410_011741 [Solanum commersonii]
MTIRNSSCTCPITLQPKEEEERYLWKKRRKALKKKCLLRDMMLMPSKLAKNYLAAHVKVASGIVPICGQNHIHVLRIFAQIVWTGARSEAVGVLFIRVPFPVGVLILGSYNEGFLR